MVKFSDILDASFSFSSQDNSPTHVPSMVGRVIIRSERSFATVQGFQVPAFEATLVPGGTCGRKEKEMEDNRERGGKRG